jgi:hypothetical protein
MDTQNVVETVGSVLHRRDFHPVYIYPNALKETLTGFDRHTSINNRFHDWLTPLSYDHKSGAPERAAKDPDPALVVLSRKRDAEREGAGVRRGISPICSGTPGMPLLRR